MELSLGAPLRRRLTRRATPICCGAALAVGAAFISSHDPSAAGARYPGCVFRQMTGLWCPGCGLTRGTYELLHGHVGAALGYNLFTPLVLVGIIGAWVVWLTRTRVHVRADVRRWCTTIGLAVLVAYAVLRNLPVTPFRALAP